MSEATLVIFLSVVFAVSTAFSDPPAYSIKLSQEREGWGWRAEVKFKDTSHPAVILIDNGEDGPPWKPDFEKSPDGRWILYVQKTGSGDNIGWLYMVEDSGRVLRVESRLDALAWQLSDSIWKFKEAELYHTGIHDWTWTDHQTLRFTLRGTKESGVGIRLRLEYDLKTNKITRVASKG